MGEAKYIYFTCLKYFRHSDISSKPVLTNKIIMPKAAVKGKGKKGGKKVAPPPIVVQKKPVNPLFEKKAQEFRDRAGHPAQTRSDPLRQMAQIRRPPEAEGRPSPASQGPASYQPVHHDLGPTHRHPGFQVVGQVSPREQAGQEAASFGQGRKEGRWQR